MKCILTFLLLCLGIQGFCTAPHAYVTEITGNSVSIIDVNRNTVQKIFGFSNPHVVRVSYDGTAAYIGDSDGTIYKINCIRWFYWEEGLIKWLLGFFIRWRTRSN